MLKVLHTNGVMSDIWEH